MEIHFCWSDLKIKKRINDTRSQKKNVIIWINSICWRFIQKCYAQAVDSFIFFRIHCKWVNRMIDISQMRQTDNVICTRLLNLFFLYCDVAASKRHTHAHNKKKWRNNIDFCVSQKHQSNKFSLHLTWISYSLRDKLLIPPEYFSQARKISNGKNSSVWKPWNNDSIKSEKKNKTRSNKESTW